MATSRCEPPRRPTPEEILARVQREEPAGRAARLKLFVGFAAGVGKTYAMLNEANRRKRESGQDVVIGFVETHGRGDTAAQIGGLEVVPRRRVEYRGVSFEEMDTPAVLARRPEWAVVDELAHTNVPGSGAHAKRYEDVLELLDAGIGVLSTLNVQHLESLNDAVRQITGVTVRETVPDRVLGRADEIVIVDITPRALINRLRRGDVYPAEKVPQALANFFTEGNLSALREIALREVASEVDRSVQVYREEHDVTEPWQTHERVMVCLSGDRSSARMLRRGWRIAHRLKADIVAVYVLSGAGRDARRRPVLDADAALAAQMGVRVEQIPGRDVAEALASYALRNRVTEIVVGHSGRTRWQEFAHGSVIDRLIRRVRGIDVLVMATEA